MEVQKKKARNLNHEQAAFRVLSIKRISCPKKSREFFGATEKAQECSPDKF